MIVKRQNLDNIINRPYCHNGNKQHCYCLDETLKKGEYKTSSSASTITIKLLNISNLEVTQFVLTQYTV